MILCFLNLEWGDGPSPSLQQQFHPVSLFFFLNLLFRAIVLGL
jgi:hypothetical protein